MIGIVVSRADSASEHIGERVLDLAAWDEDVDDAASDAEGGGTYYRRPGFELRTFDELHLHLDDVAAAFREPSMVVFLSRHSGDTGPLLSAHFTGNFGPAQYGGESGELARACPNAQRAVVAALAAHAPDGYDVGIECTHHGPSRTRVPSMFVELGSGPDEWGDPAGAEAVARAVLDIEGTAPDRVDGDRTRHVVGFGGGHYAPRFERIVRETDWAVGHVGADWPLDAMGHPRDHADVVRAAFDRSPADLAVVDGDRPVLVDVVEEVGFRVVSETFLRATTEVPRALVSRLEATLGPVDDGLRFGAHARVGVAAAESDDNRAAPEFDVVNLPGDLLDETLGIDASAARASVDAHAVGYLTAEGGRRPTGRAALPVPDAAYQSAPADRAGTTGDAADADSDDAAATYDRLVAGLCDVLRDRYAEVSRDGDVVIARERAFDPAAATDLGVAAGPAFGRLASGESVEVDGRRVDPAEVHRDRTTRFEI